MKSQPVQVTDTQTRSRSILGYLEMSLSNLKAVGVGEPVQFPEHLAPADSPFIISATERFTLSVDVEFNQQPLSQLLLCLGTPIKVNFALEGLGQATPDVDLAVQAVTRKGEFVYTVTFEGTPRAAGMLAGLYGISATVEIGPAEHDCSQQVYGYGYIAGVLLQVYAS